MVVSSSRPGGRLPFARVNRFACGAAMLDTKNENGAPTMPTERRGCRMTGLALKAYMLRFVDALVV